MKKRILYLSVIIAVVLVGFCVYKIANPSIVKVNDEQVKSVTSSVCLSEDGYYYTSDLMILYFCDRLTGETIVACNKPDCGHGSDACNARFSTAGVDEMICNIFEYAGSLYVETRSLEGAGGRVYACDMVSGKKELVLKAEGPMEGMVVSQGCLYYMVEITHQNHMEEVEENSFVEWSEGTCELHRFDLRTGKDRVLYEWSSGEECVSPTYSLCTGNYDATRYIYGILFYHKSVEEAVSLETTDMHASLYRYDIESGKMEAYAIPDALSMSGGYGWVYDDRLYYTHYEDSCTDIICYDPASQEGELYIRSDRDGVEPQYIDGYIAFACNRDEVRRAYFDMESEQLYIREASDNGSYSILGLSRDLNLVAYDGTDYTGFSEGLYTYNPCTYMIDNLDSFLTSQYALYENGYEPYVFLGD